MKSLFFSALTLLFSVSAVAQVTMEVTAVDKRTSDPIQEVIINVTNTSIGYSNQKLTNEQGKAFFNGLPTSGSYKVFISESPEYYGIVADDIVLKSNKTRSITLVVNSKSTVQLDEITVTAPISRINTINAEVSSELDVEEIESLPVEGRDITRALYRLPNVTQATGFFAEAPNVSINGSNSLYTNYLIDGLDNNEQFLGGQKFAVPVGLVQNVTVLTNNYSVEFGQSSNGIFNITTKSGSNNVEGEAFFVTRPGPVLDASSDFAQRDLSGNQVDEGFQRYQGGFAVGGPIKKDKTFYFINAEGTLDLKDNFLNSPELGVNETIRGENSFIYLSGKLDHEWNPRFRSSLRVNSGLVAIDRQGGGLEGGVTFPSAGNEQDRNSLLIASKNTYVHSNFTSQTDLQYSRFRWNFADPRNPDSPNVTVLGPSDLPVAILGHPGFVFDSKENTFQLKQKFTFNRGNHSLKVGGGIISSDHSLFGGGNPNGSYTVRLNQQQLDQVRTLQRGGDLNVQDIPADVEVLNYSVELRPQEFGKTQNLFSFFVEDLYSVSSKLNLTFGLRYDYDNLSKGGSDHGDFNNIAPRFNFNYRLNDETSIRGGYGLFYDKIVYAVYSDALQRSTTSDDFKTQLQALIDAGALPEDTDIDRVTFDGNIAASVAGVAYLQGPSPEELQSQRGNVFSNELRILNPNGFDNPYSHQFTLGYQRQLSENKLFYVDLIHSRTENLYRLKDVNTPAPFPIDPENPQIRTTEEADASRVTPVGQDSEGFFVDAGGERLRGGGRNIVITETAGSARYWAASFNIDKKRGADDYAYRITYTLSELRNNTEDINFRAMDANDFDEEWGPSINDRTHVINGYLTYFPLEGLSLNIAAQLQSGQPINRIPDASRFGTTDLNGDGRSFNTAFVGNSDRSPGESRNSDRLPWSNTFDLSVKYLLNVAGGNKIELSADVFNLFNAENLSGYSNNATQSNQIQAGPESSGVFVQRNAGPPRQFQFSIRYLF